MGQTHLRALAGGSNVAIVAVCEPVVDLRERAQTTYDLGGFAVLDDMIEHGGIDGALVVTPSDTHVEVVATLAAAGLPVLCEKPCGVTPDDTRRAQQLVSDAGVPMQVAYWRRFVPELQSLRERMLAGDFGEILSVSCLQWDGAPPSASFRARSGGIFVDMGVHEFDQARWLTSSDLHGLTATGSAVEVDPNDPVDPDSALALAATRSGATVLVSLGRHFADGDMSSVEVFGTRNHVLSEFLNPADGERAQLEALRRQAGAFAEFARGGPCLGATAEDAVAALEAATDAARQLTAARS